MPRLVLRRLLSRQKAFEAPLASGFSTNKNGVPSFHSNAKQKGFFVLDEAKIPWHNHSTVLFSVVYRLALVCLPHVPHVYRFPILHYQTFQTIVN